MARGKLSDIDYLKCAIEFGIVVLIGYAIASSIKYSLNGVSGITPWEAVGIQLVSFFMIILIYYGFVKVVTAWLKS